MNTQGISPTDDELIQLAAKAVGITDRKLGKTYGDYPCLIDARNLTAWTPIMHDTDAFDLQARLKLDLVWHTDGMGVYAGTHDRESGAVEYFDNHNGDRKAALRRAITRAAVEIWNKKQ